MSKPTEKTKKRHGREGAVRTVCVGAAWWAVHNGTAEVRTRTL